MLFLMRSLSGYQHTVFHKYLLFCIVGLKVIVFAVIVLVFPKLFAGMHD